MTNKAQKERRASVPELYVERFALSELPADVAERVQDELGGTERCAERLAQLEKENDAVLDAYPPDAVVAEIRRRCTAMRAKRRRIRLFIGMPTIAAAAAMAVFVVSPMLSIDTNTTDSANPYGEITRVKGAAAILVYRRKNEHVERLKHNAWVHAGDVLQVAYRSANARYGVIVSVDGRGNVTLHFPLTPSASTRLVAEKTQTLPHAFELDDAPRFERFFFVTSKRALDVGEVIAAARALGGNRDARLQLPDTRAVKELLLNKR